MAYATQLGVSNTTVHVTPATSINVAIPNGANVAGRLIIIWHSKDGTTGPSWPGGWTSFCDQQVPASGTAWASAGYRITDGTEGFTGSGDTITLTTDSVEQGAFCWLFDTPLPPFIAGPASGTATHTNPPALGIAYTDDYHWLAPMTTNGNVLSAYPTNYTLDQSEIRPSASGAYEAARCRRQLNGWTDDPGAYTIGTGGDWVSCTIAVGLDRRNAAEKLRILSSGRW